MVDVISRTRFKESATAFMAKINDPEVQNMHGIVEAEPGNFNTAREEWGHLSRVAPDYTPARSNLVSLGAISSGDCVSGSITTYI